MKSTIIQTNKKAAFTIVELLTVMSIIVILIGLLVPALNQVRKYAREVRQQAQFNSISVAIELFNSEFDRYPDSGRLDNNNNPYCGAMKLAEAMVGQDLMGFHQNSVFLSSGNDLSGRYLYDPLLDLGSRKGPYLPIENANAYRLRDIYGEDGSNKTGPFLSKHYVLCDVFGRVTDRATGQRIGMPILYYKANTANRIHRFDEPQNSIYNYYDNEDLVALGKPFDLDSDGNPKPHALSNIERFYLNTENYAVSTVDLPRPFRADTYILISAGNDGEYGTSDDICNYDWRYRELN